MIFFKFLLSAKKKSLNSVAIIFFILFSCNNNSSAQIVINEIGIAPKIPTPCSIPSIDGGNGGEFLELFNTSTSSSIDISCYVLMYSGGTTLPNPTGWTVTIPAGTAPIPPGGYYIIAGGGISTSTNNTWLNCPIGGTPFNNTFGTNVTCPLLDISTTSNSNLNALIPGNYSNNEAQVNLYNQSGGIVYSISYNGGNNSASYTTSFNKNPAGCSIISPLTNPGLSTNTVSGSFSGGSGSINGIVRDASGNFSTSNALTPGLPNSTPLSGTCTPPTIGAITGSTCSGGSSSLSIVYTSAAPTHYTIDWNPTANSDGFLDVPTTAFSSTVTSSPVAVAIVIPPTASASTYSGTITFTNACSGGAIAFVSCPKAFTITPSTAPVITNQTPAAICSGASFTVSPTGVPFGTKYTWTVATNTNVTGQSAALTAQTSISQTLSNLTNVDQTVVYTVTPTSGSCIGANFTVTVTVKPTPTFPATISTNACSGLAFNYFGINSAPTIIVPTGTTYSWPSPTAIPNVSGQTSGTSQTTIGQTLTNTSTTAQTLQYLNIIPTAGGCTGSSFTLRVKVNPTPSIGAQTKTICSNTGFSISTFTGTPSPTIPTGTTYTWTVVPNINISGQNDQPVSKTAISDTLINNTSLPDSVLYIVTPESASPFCAGTPFIITVKVNPLPVLTITNPPTACAPSTVNLSDPAIVAGSYNFNPAAVLSYSYYTDALGTNALTTTTTPPYTAVNISDTFYIRMVARVTPICTSMIKPVIVKIIPIPTITITNPMAVCTSISTVNITAPSAITAGSTSGLTYSYYIDSPTTTMVADPTAVTSGDYYLKGTTIDGCAAVRKVTVPLKSFPPPPSVVSPVYFCQYDGVGPLTASGSFPLRWYNYPTGGTPNPIAPRPSTTSVGDFSYYVGQIDTPCASLTRSLITVKVNNKPNLGPDKDIKVCFGTAVNLDTLFTLTNLTAGWYLTNGDPVDNPNAVTQSGLYEVYVADSANCQDDAKVNIVFLPKVLADARDSGVALLNTPHQLYGSGSGSQFLWTPSSFLNFSTIQNPEATLSSDTKFYLTVTNNDGCKGYDTLLVSVLNIPGFYIPKAFTPNGDGLNDFLKPVPVGVVKLNYFKVFNRKGQMVFETTTLGTGWDGTYKGQKQDVEAYVYMISGVLQTGQITVTKGNVILIR